MKDLTQFNFSNCLKTLYTNQIKHFGRIYSILYGLLLEFYDMLYLLLLFVF